MSKKKVTLKDIGDAAGISSASVSMILAKKSLSRFSSDTVDTVYALARELGYEKKSGKYDKKVLAIVCPSVMNPYFATIIQGMEQEASLRGLDTMLFTTYWDTEKEKRICEFAKDPMVGGVVFAMIPQQPDLVRELNKSVPVVAVGDKQNELGLDTVDVNNFTAGSFVGKHLLQLGHRKVAYVSTSLNSEHSARVRRYEGLKAEFRLAGSGAKLSLFTSEVASSTELNTVDIEHQTGYELAKRCIRETPQVTAIVAINDMVAYGVIDAIHDAGFSIPRDYSVCGFDNIYPSSFRGVSLTTVEHYIIQVGRSAIRLISDKMAKKPPVEVDSGAVTRVEYRSRLIIRNSTGEPGPRG
ncbi:LacI family DNA-binding transcriptional regulator [Sphaerochaeta sp. PS]|uniref:LacI family DNA-binding transcriptional regulator n=1 Tax=Sphaerochaeta sp. PS TaxID=3076336 RepID=UPI0028A34A38|nr:LacI family DNA-binding transcriptional regulator [Sphaerochaeta sp. PS]MDT4762503.1 LacI family DNA-binding transcriptional regulator [Sphaerochaeta sp. PS]